MLCVLSAFCVKICLVYIYIDWPVAMESEYFNVSPFIALPSTIKHKDAVLEEEDCQARLLLYSAQSSKFNTQRLNLENKEQS